MTVPVPAIGGVTGTGADLSQIFTNAQDQILSGTSGLDPSTASGATSGLSGVSGASGIGGVSDAATTQAAATRGADFGNLITSSLGQVEQLDNTASSKAIQAATGNLTDIQDYVIAAEKAQTATELTTTIRNKAVDSFNEIMRMSL